RTVAVGAGGAVRVDQALAGETAQDREQGGDGGWALAGAVEHVLDLVRGHRPAVVPDHVHDGTFQLAQDRHGDPLLLRRARDSNRGGRSATPDRTISTTCRMPGAGNGPIR